MQTSKFIKRTDDGTEGIHPSKLTMEDFQEMGHLPLGFRKAIKKNCVDCCNGSYSEVVKCVSLNCALYPYRTGKNPFKPKREYTDEERQIARERFARNMSRPQDQDQDDDEE